MSPGGNGNQNPNAIEVRGLRHRFGRQEVLRGVDLDVPAGQITTIVGPSGCGKSTLLRIINGIVPATSGQVLYRGRQVDGINLECALVFQSFALFPWLTVQKNVEIGLEAQGVSRAERARRAESAIELIGLSGFEGALPRELSGGMRQRVGIARALVMEPEVLLMDEAFSALDVLTGERLRDDILALWASRQIPIKAILVVSHNIEDAVMMADRVLVFGSNPGRVREELHVSLPLPRDVESQRVRALVDTVYGLMTARTSRSARVASKLQIGDRLPNAGVSHIEGVLELLMEEPYLGKADLPMLAESVEFSDEDLLDIAAALALLGFVSLEFGDIAVNEFGKRYLAADPAERKRMFGEQVMEHVPLIAYIRQGLEQDPSGDLHEHLFLRLLHLSLDEAEAERVLRTAVEWGRYGDVFEYDFNTGVLQLPRPQ